VRKVISRKCKAFGKRSSKAPIWITVQFPLFLAVSVRMQKGT